MTKDSNAADAARLAFLLNELRLPAIKQLWPDIAALSDKEGWPAARFLAALAEHELAQRAMRRTERHLLEARLPVGKTLDSFDFNAVPVISKAHVMALASGNAWLESGGQFVTVRAGRHRKVASLGRPSGSHLSKPATASCSPELPIWFSGCRSPVGNWPSRQRSQS